MEGGLETTFYFTIDFFKINVKYTKVTRPDWTLMVTLRVESVRVLFVKKWRKLYWELVEWLKCSLIFDWTIYSLVPIASSGLFLLRSLSFGQFGDWACRSGRSQLVDSDVYRKVEVQAKRKIEALNWNLVIPFFNKSNLKLIECF